MNDWKRSFVGKLNKAQGQWVSRFEEALDKFLLPVFDDHEEFLSNNGFRLARPLREPGHRSFKFELAENAYLLMTFRATGVGEFELRCEGLAPGSAPGLCAATFRVADLDENWATEHLHGALDAFADVLAGDTVKATEPEPAAV